MCKRLSILVFSFYVVFGLWTLAKSTVTSSCYSLVVSAVETGTKIKVEVAKSDLVAVL